jgi:predicted XRE-type DNA-binding protein
MNDKHLNSSSLVFPSVWDVIDSNPIERQCLEFRFLLMSEIREKLEQLIQNSQDSFAKLSQCEISVAHPEKLHEFKLNELVDFANKLGLVIPLNIRMKIALEAKAQIMPKPTSKHISSLKNIISKPSKAVSIEDMKAAVKPVNKVSKQEAWDSFFSSDHKVSDDFMSEREKE